MSDTAELLMDLAEARIRNAGYSGFSFRELAAAAGIKSASVHHHFATKPSMAAAVARRYAQRFFESVKPKLNETPEDAIAAYREALRSSFSDDGRVCVFAVLGAEAGGLSAEVSDEIHDFFRKCIEDLTLRIGGEDAHSRAVRVMAALEGGIIIAGIFRDVAVFDRAAEGLERPAVGLERATRVSATSAQRTAGSGG